jgi:hypothetical protein
VAGCSAGEWATIGEVLLPERDTIGSLEETTGACLVCM